MKNSDLMVSAVALPAGFAGQIGARAESSAQERL
jgi:hypothetical protein